MNSLSYYSDLFGFTFFYSLGYPALPCFPYFLCDTVPCPWLPLQSEDPVGPPAETLHHLLLLQPLP